MNLSEIDRQLILATQSGLPLTKEPYQQIANLEKRYLSADKRPPKHAARLRRSAIERFIHDSQLDAGTQRQALPGG